MPEPQLKLTKKFGGKDWQLRHDVTTKRRGSDEVTVPVPTVTLSQGTMVRCIAVERSGKHRALHIALEVDGAEKYVEADPRTLLGELPHDDATEEQERLVRFEQAVTATKAYLARYVEQWEGKWCALKVPLHVPVTLGDGSRRLTTQMPGTPVYVTRAKVKCSVDSDRDFRPKVEECWTSFELGAHLIVVRDVPPQRYLRRDVKPGQRQPIKLELEYRTEILQDAIRARV